MIWILVFDDRTYTNLCVPAFIELPKRYQEETDFDPVQKTTPNESWFCSQASLTFRKVAYGVLLHIISGILYGVYAIYLVFSRQLKDFLPFHIAAGCYFLGILIYSLSVGMYYKVQCLSKKLVFWSFMKQNGVYSNWYKLS